MPAIHNTQHATTEIIDYSIGSRNGGIGRIGFDSVRGYNGFFDPGEINSSFLDDAFAWRLKINLIEFVL
jgi:hypothetical protein